MIFIFDQKGNLPPGIHLSTWEEIEEFLAYNKRRQRLLAGMKQGSEILKQCGCSRIYIGGSYVTSKMRPNDFDVCWEKNQVNFKLLQELEPALLNFSNGRAEQKRKYGGEFLIADSQIDPFTTYLDFFQQDRNGNPKGIIAIDI